MKPTVTDSINIYWKRVCHMLKKASKPIFKDLGLNRVDANILMTLSYENEQTKSELADYFSFKPNALTRSLDRLVELELIHRVSSPHDKRYIKVSLSKKGAQVANQYIKHMPHFWKKGLADFNEKELQALDNTLKRIFGNLTK